MTQSLIRYEIRPQSGMYRAGYRQCRYRLYRWHGRLCDDRAKHDQCEIRRARQAIALCRRFVLLILVAFLGEWVAQIPMPALVAVMIVVSARTFSWSSLGNLRTHPRSSSVVMLAMMAAVVRTYNLAIGVLLSGIFFAARIAHLFRVTTQPG
ncbi:hypothetical protein SAMN02746000_03210 [Paracoccus sp. J56]|nr:hypothetical protein SAMN02746000_03210 [Paracoccus sp. J56]